MKTIKVSGKTGYILFYFNKGLLLGLWLSFEEVTDKMLEFLKEHMPKKENDLVHWYSAGFTIDGKAKYHGIPFTVFWERYNLKRHKLESERIWMKMNINDQRDALAPLDKWNPQYKPYPEKYLRNKLWLDEDLLKQPAVTAKSKYPDDYSRAYEMKLKPDELMEYRQHLRSLGLVPKKDVTGKIVDWAKPNQ